MYPSLGSAFCLQLNVTSMQKLLERSQARQPLIKRASRSSSNAKGPNQRKTIELSRCSSSLRTRTILQSIVGFLPSSTRARLPRDAEMRMSRERSKDSSFSPRRRVNRRRRSVSSVLPATTPSPPENLSSALRKRANPITSFRLSPVRS